MDGSDGLRSQRLIHDGCAIVRPSGVLDAASYGDLRNTLLKEGAEEPRAVIVDLDDLRVLRATSLSVFPAVSTQLSLWPGVPLVLACGQEELATMLWAGPIPRFVGTFTSVTAAIAAVELPPPRRRRHIEVACTGGASRLARRWIRDVCSDWGLTADATETVEFVGSELVENVVQHAGTPGRLRLEQHRAGLSVAAYDGDPRPPVLHEPTVTRSDGGRGIATVAKLATAWGHNPRRSTGKVVWAVLPLPLGGSEPAGPSAPAGALRHGFARSGMSATQLWLAYVALGGSMRHHRLEAVLLDADIPAPEHDILAHALNEQLTDRGLAAVPYRADIPTAEIPTADVPHGPA